SQDMYIIFDTETTGLPKDWNLDFTQLISNPEKTEAILANWPRAIQIAWQLHDDFGKLIEARDYLIKPNGFDIPFDAERIHGISTQLAMEQGEEPAFVFGQFREALDKAKFVVGQNVGFDNNIMGCEFKRFEIENNLHE